MITVGINEDVYLSAASIDDKDTIHVTFKEVAKAGKEVKSLFAMAASDQAEEVDNGTSIMIFPPLPPKEDSTLTEEKKVERAVADINKVKGQCLHLLKGYYTVEQLAGKMEPFAGLGLSEATFNKEILRKEVLASVQRNIGRTFIQMIAPHLNKPDMKFRLLLVRQSQDKHFATLRGRYLDDQPFWEDMQVPKEQSKVKFSDYEIANGLNSGTPSAKPAKDAGAGTTPAAPVSAANVFGQ